MATAGSAVGLGNVWRFPYMTGQNGGAAFILIYLGCVLLLGIPCMLSEFIIGRHGAANTSRVYAKVAESSAADGEAPSRWRLLFPKFIGFLGITTGFLITSYYAVVSGWCLQYIYASAAGELKGDADYVTTYFAEFSTSPLRPIFWTVAILFITHFVICRGVRGGIERASKLLMPTLFILLLVIVVASCMLPGASEGIRFLLKPDSRGSIPACSSEPSASRSIRLASAWAASPPMPATTARRQTCSPPPFRYRLSTRSLLSLPV